jgi:hypothetical protein
VRITPTDALQILLRAWQPGDAAALQLTIAMRGNACLLWCNHNPVAINIKLTLAVEARAEPDGRWGATIVSTAREAWEHPPDYYHWEFDDNEVAALLPPPPPSDRAADGESRRTGSRMQRLIRQIADETWPGGWEDIETRHIIKIVGEELKNRREHVPERSTFERALGRRRPR